LDNRKYPTELANVKAIKAKLSKTDYALLEKEFTAAMEQNIFPFWYGTKWDFNGTTQMPNEGKIACGYFVTTTLSHAGVPLNRVKLAQAASETMIRELTEAKNIHHISNTSISIFEDKMKKLGNGLYIIGLDNHTGFISISETGNYFIHSSGGFPFQVVKEKISKSKVLKKSNYKVVGKISADKSFLKKWINHSF
jgi:hypothetical protein